MPKKKGGGKKGPPMRHDHTKDAEDKRILVLDHDHCKPKSEAFEFLKRQAGRCGRTCIRVVGKKIDISEDLCAVCLTRAKQCPGQAVKILKLPANLETDCTHRYGKNTFKLHGLPIPRPGSVLGLLGCNGTGKSTAINVLAGKLKPNLGVIESIAPTWGEIVTYYRGSDLQNYFNALLEERLRCVVKPQLDPAIIRLLVGKKVGEILERKNQRRNLDEVVEKLELRHLMDREVQHLSGGELQRFAIAAAMVTQAEAYFFDEPCSFLDVKQRLAATDMIRSLVDPETHRAAGVDDAAGAADNTYVVVVEHDLTILDYCSDYICCLYGEPGGYGVVTKRCTTASGINQFLAGYFQAENMRFRSEELTFQVSVQDLQEGTVLEAVADSEEKGAADALAQQRMGIYPYPAMSKTLVSKRGGSGTESRFTLHVEAGSFRDAEVIGLMGQVMRPSHARHYLHACLARATHPLSLPNAQTRFISRACDANDQNGCGKTTFMELLAGVGAASKAVDRGGDAAAPAGGDASAAAGGGAAAAAGSGAAAAPPKPPDDGGSPVSLKSFGVSYKRQHTGPRFRKFSGTVRDFCETYMQQGLQDRLFRMLVMKPLSMDLIIDLPVKSLSGGEMQRLAICVCLGEKARVYLIDEPSAGLDCEQRIIVAKVIKRWVVSHMGKTAFIIEHDMVMAAALYDRVAVFEGTPGVECTALAPQTPTDGFNQFLKQLDVTFRRDPYNFRPRINKKNSTLDRKQKAEGVFYSLEVMD